MALRKIELIYDSSVFAFRIFGTIALTHATAFMNAPNRFEFFLLGDNEKLYVCDVFTPPQ